MRLKGYRTILLGVSAAAVGAVETFLPFLIQILGLPEVQTVVPKEWLPWILLAVGVGGVILRTKTDTPVGKGSKE